MPITYLHNIADCGVKGETKRMIEVAEVAASVVYFIANPGIVCSFLYRKLFLRNTHKGNRL